MATKGKREELMIYLADATDKKVNALYALLEGEIKEHAFTLNEEHNNILEERSADYRAGNSQPSPWEDAHARIRNKRKNT